MTLQQIIDAAEAAKTGGAANLGATPELVWELIQALAGNSGGGGGGSETLQEVLDNGSTLNKNNTVQLADNYLDINGGDPAQSAEYGDVISSKSNFTYYTKNADGSQDVYLQAQRDSGTPSAKMRVKKDANTLELLIANGTDPTLKLNNSAFIATADEHIVTKKFFDDIINGLSQDVVIAGTGTLTFTRGILTAFTPE